jgi:hypothetical protein
MNAGTLAIFDGCLRDHANTGGNRLVMLPAGTAGRTRIVRWP